MFEEYVETKSELNKCKVVEWSAIGYGKLYEKFEAEGKARKTVKAQELWFEILESPKLVDVFVHVSRVRRDEDGADAGYHVTRDQACVAD